MSHKNSEEDQRDWSAHRSTAAEQRLLDNNDPRDETTGDIPHRTLPRQNGLTLRAILAGLSIGTLLAFTNMYFGLQTGWISMMSLQSSLLGFALFKILPGRHRPLSVGENILIQTTSTAVGSMPLTTGLVGIIPALGQLDIKTDGAPPIVFSLSDLIKWSLAIAFFGVFLAIPLRKQVIIKEKLVFPSGTATAQMLSVLHRTKPPTTTGYHPSNSPSEQWNVLSSSFSASLIFTLLSLAFPVLYAIPIFDVFGPLAHKWYWWFTPSFAFIGQGIIMGFHTAYSMMVGMIVGWAFLSPLAVHQGWTKPADSKGWIMWPALSIMIVESIFSLLSVVLSMLKNRRSNGGSNAIEDEEGDKEKGLIGPKMSLLGFGFSCLICVAIMGMMFEHIRWWATVVALLLASVFSLLGVRALGETDLNPVSAIGKISQLIFGIIQPNNIVANLIAGGISEAGAMQSGEIMQDFKTAQLHNVSAGHMFYGQIIGSFVSVFVSSGVYRLYSRTYTFPSTAFPVPTAAVWLNLARLVNRGELPEGSKMMMIWFGMIFMITGILKILKDPKSGILNERNQKKLNWIKYLPSGIAFSVGFINTPSFSISRFLGGLISYRYLQSKKKDDDQEEDEVEREEKRKLKMIIIASGFVLGEGFGSVIGLIIRSLGFEVLSCFGCHSYGGGYCGGC